MTLTHGQWTVHLLSPYLSSNRYDQTSGTASVQQKKQRPYPTVKTAASQAVIKKGKHDMPHYGQTTGQLMTVPLVSYAEVVRSTCMQ